MSTFETADTHFEDYECIQKHQTENIKIFTRLSQFRVPPLPPYEHNTNNTPSQQVQDKQAHLNKVQAHGYSQFNESKIQRLCEEIWSDIYKYEPRFKDASRETRRLVLMKSHADLKYFPSNLEASRINSQLTLFAEVPLDVFPQLEDYNRGVTIEQPTNTDPAEETDISINFIAHPNHCFITRTGPVARLVLDSSHYKISDQPLLMAGNIFATQTIESISCYFKYDFFRNFAYYEQFPFVADVHMIDFDRCVGLNQDTLVGSLELIHNSRATA